MVTITDIERVRKEVLRLEEYSDKPPNARKSLILSIAAAGVAAGCYLLSRKFIGNEPFCGWNGPIDVFSSWMGLYSICSFGRSFKKNDARLNAKALRESLDTLTRDYSEQVAMENLDYIYRRPR